MNRFEKIMFFAIIDLLGNVYFFQSKTPVAVMMIARRQMRAKGGSKQDNSKPAPKVISDVPS